VYHVKQTAVQSLSMQNMSYNSNAKKKADGSSNNVHKLTNNAVFVRAIYHLMHDRVQGTNVRE